MKKVFINYSWKSDSGKALALYKLLSETNHLDVWIDKQDLQPGLKWRPAIRKAIRESDFFISVLSANSVKGRGERNKEIYEALDVLKEFPPAEIYLIPARVDECLPPFEEMLDLQWVDLFPDFDEGVNNLLGILGVSKLDKKLFNSESKRKNLSKYHYRVGIVDIDMGLVNIPDIAAQLNKAQSYFLFTTPQMPSLKRSTEVIRGLKNFAVYKVPESYIAEHRHLGVDLIACITKYPLAFKENDNILFNYFAGQSDLDERFMFLSADHLYEFCKEAGCTFEEGIVSILISQIIVYFTNAGYHQETKGCVMDFCENRRDLVHSLKNRIICKGCLSELTDGELREALFKLLGWRYS